MSYEDYKLGQHIEADYDSDLFYGILQGLMRLADTENLGKLRSVFPDVYGELRARYSTPCGLLEGER